MIDEDISIKCDGHQTGFMSTFAAHLDNGTLVDCTLAADDGQYLNAHKIVLSSSSPYFNLLLGQNYDKHPIFILKDIKFDELKSLVHYIYRGEVNIPQEQVEGFMNAARSLQLKGLPDHPVPRPTPK